jgi:molecular chaperone GrpE
MAGFPLEDPLSLFMKERIKKIFNMEHKEPDVPEQESASEIPAQEENQDTNTPESGKTETLQRQLDEAKSKYLYLFSDFENFKRNSAKERMDLIQTAGRDIMAALLPVLDDFDRAAKNGGLPEGIQLIQNKLQHTLEVKGLRRLQTVAGDDFNADIHEAVAEIPAASEELKGKIVDILEHGYQLGERIIRFSKVVVGR